MAKVKQLLLFIAVVAAICAALAYWEEVSACGNLPCPPATATPAQTVTPVSTATPRKPKATATPQRTATPIPTSTPVCVPWTRCTATPPTRVPPTVAVPEKPENTPVPPVGRSNPAPTPEGGYNQTRIYPVVSVVRIAPPGAGDGGLSR